MDNIRFLHPISHLWERPEGRGAQRYVKGRPKGAAYREKSRLKDAPQAHRAILTNQVGGYMPPFFSLDL